MSREILSQADEMLDQLTPDEQWLLTERLLQRLRPTVQLQKQTQDLYGTWQSAFPPDLDLDAELAEIRGEWKKEWRNLER